MCLRKPFFGSVYYLEIYTFMSHAASNRFIYFGQRRAAANQRGDRVTIVDVRERWRSLFDFVQLQKDIYHAQ